MHCPLDKKGRPTLCRHWAVSDSVLAAIIGPEYGVRSRSRPAAHTAPTTSRAKELFEDKRQDEGREVRRQEGAQAEVRRLTATTMRSASDSSAIHPDVVVGASGVSRPLALVLSSAIQVTHTVSGTTNPMKSSSPSAISLASIGQVLRRPPAHTARPGDLGADGCASDHVWITPERLGCSTADVDPVDSDLAVRHDERLLDLELELRTVVKLSIDHEAAREAEAVLHPDVLEPVAVVPRT